MASPSPIVLAVLRSQKWPCIQVEDRPLAGSHVKCELPFDPIQPLGCAPFGGSELRHGVNLRRPKWATRQGGNNASSVTGPANANYLLTGGRNMTTSKPQKLLLRLIVLFAICASIPRWPATPKQGVIS